MNLQFSNRLQRLMDERGVKPFGLAKQIGISHVAVGNWLRDQKPSMPDAVQLLRLSQLFGVSMEWLLTGRMEVEPHSMILREDPPLPSPRLSRAELARVKEQLMGAVEAAFADMAKKI